MMSPGWKPPLRLSGFALWAALFAAFLFGPPAARAQAPESSPGDAAAPPTGILKIRSEPSGALIRLTGEHRWTGTTPWDLQRGIEGTFRVEARLGGYERWHRTVSIARGEARDLEIRLTPKQPYKAGIRSLILPGWGQIYGERPVKGSIFMLGTLVFAGGFCWTEMEYRDRVDDYRSARRAYFDSVVLDDLPRLRVKAEKAQGRMDRAHDRRQIAVYATAALYAAAFLDAVFLFPAPSEGSFASLAPWGDGGPRLTLGAPRGEITLALRWSEREGGER